MSAIHLITDLAKIYETNPLDSTELMERSSHIFTQPKGKFLIVGFVQHYQNKKIHPMAQESIDRDIGVVYLCDELPEKPIIHPNIVYVQVGFDWFIHTLFMKPLLFKGSFSDEESSRTSRAFGSFTQYQIPCITSYQELNNLSQSIEENSENILLDITGGIGDHLMCIPTIKTLAKKYNKKVYILCTPERYVCYENLPYISGFYKHKSEINIAKFSKIHWLHFGQLLNDYSLDLNKQNRIYSIAQACGLTKEDLIIRKPEIIFSNSEVRDAKLKWSVYKNKLFFGFDSNRIDSRISQGKTQQVINRLKSYGFTVFISSLREHNLQNCINLTKQLSVRELFGLLTQMDIVLTVDTSFLHIAGALEKPVFVLMNYFPNAWRCSTYKNLQAFNPNVSCSPCIGGQAVPGKPRQCFCNKSCYDFFDWNIIVKTVKHYFKSRQGKIPEGRILVSDLANEKYIPCTEKIDESNILSKDLRISNPRDTKSKIRIAAFWMGGIGDAVMLSYLCRAISRKYPNSIIDAYVRDPHQAQLLIFDYPKIRGCSSAESWGATLGKHKNDYDIIYEFRHYPYVWYKANPKLNRPFDKVKYDNWQLASQDIINIWKSQVFYYYAQQTDLEIIDSDLRIPLTDIDENISSGYLRKYNLPEKYVTIHSGCDRGVGIMKLWNSEKWNELIILLRAENITVIQLGTKEEKGFAGVQKVEVNNLIDLSYILKFSKLHIDNEGGLVHLAHAVNTKSVVLFGATSLTLYGYPDNINIYKNICPTCWWKVNNWSKTCMNGNSECINLKELSVSEVYEKIKETYE